MEETGTDRSLVDKKIHPGSLGAVMMTEEKTRESSTMFSRFTLRG